jgi:hypothetical protein
MTVLITIGTKQPTTIPLLLATSATSRLATAKHKKILNIIAKLGYTKLQKTPKEIFYALNFSLSCGAL